METNLIVIADSKWGLLESWKLEIIDNYINDITYNSNKKNVIMTDDISWKCLLMDKIKNRIIIVISLLDNGNDPDIYYTKSFDEGIELYKKLNAGNLFIYSCTNDLYRKAHNELQISKINLVRIDQDYKCDYEFPINIFIKIFSNIDSSLSYMFDGVKINFSIRNAICAHCKNDILEKVSNDEEQNYLNLLKNILANGRFRSEKYMKIYDFLYIFERF